MGKEVTTSSCSWQGTRRSLRIKLIQTKRIQLKRDLSKRVQPLRGEIKSLKRQRRRPTRAQSPSWDYKQVQSQVENSKCMHPKRGKLIQPQCSIPKRVQPKRGKLTQPTLGKPLGLKPQSGKPKGVKPQPRIPKCVHSQRPKFIQQRKGSLIQRRRRHPKCNEKQPKPTQQLPETMEHTNAHTPVSLRIQIKMAVKNSQITTPAEVALSNERYDKCMDVKGNRRAHLHSASLKGNHAQVKSYLKKSHNPNLPCQDGWTALHDACLYGHEKVVEVLLKGGAEVNIQHPNGETPLFGAVTADNSKIVKLLINHDANPLLKNDECLEVSHFAKSAFKEYLQNIKDFAYDFVLAELKKNSNQYSLQ